MSTDLHGPDADPAHRWFAPPPATAGLVQRLSAPGSARQPPVTPSPPATALAGSATLPAAVGAQPTDPPGWRIMFAILQNRGGELHTILTVLTYVIAVLSLAAVILFLTGTAGWLALGSGTLGGITVAVKVVRTMRKPAGTDPGVSRSGGR